MTADERDVPQEIIDLIVLIGKDPSYTRIQRCVSIIAVALREYGEAEFTRGYAEGSEWQMKMRIRDRLEAQEGKHV